MSNNRFGLRLKELRQRAGLTQPQLAEKAGLSKPGIAHIEQGDRQPSWDTALALADALGVPIEEFRRPPSKGTTPQRRGRPPKAEVTTKKVTKPRKK